MPCVQEKVEQIRQRVADTLGDGTHVALTQAIPGMLEVGRLHGLPGMLRVGKLFARGHAYVMEACIRDGGCKGHSSGSWLRAACSAQEAASWDLQSAQQAVRAAKILHGITGCGS